MLSFIKNFTSKLKLATTIQNIPDTIDYLIPLTVYLIQYSSFQKQYKFFRNIKSFEYFFIFLSYYFSRKIVVFFGETEVHKSQKLIEKHISFLSGSSTYREATKEFSQVLILRTKTFLSFFKQRCKKCLCSFF